MHELNKHEHNLEFLLESDYEEKINKAYKKYNKKCVDHLNTELPFVLYDKVEAIYFAASDPIGVQPIYYTVSHNNVFHFAKDIGILFKKSGIKKEVNLQTIKSIVYNSTIAYDQTMYKSIKRLPPGHYMYISNEGECTIERYWKPEKIEINYGISEKEAKETFLSLLDKAIFDRIDDLSSTGFELSGGLDSSTVVSWVKYKNPKECINAFSMNFKSMENCDESEYIDAMKEADNIDIHNLATDHMDYSNKYSLENNYKLNPYWPIFITNTMGFSVVEKARELGIKTILTGQGGDHILTGNPYVIHEYFRKLQWFRLYKELTAVAHKKNAIKRYLIFPLLGEKNVLWLRSMLQKSKNQKVKDKNISNISFQEFSDLYEGNSITFKFDLAQVLHSTLSVLMQSSYYQVAERCFGIEFKHPFLDRTLIEFMLSLPPRFKYSEGIGKSLLRTSMEGVLPEKIRLRTDKAEFSEVLRQQIDVIDLDDLLGNANLVKLGLIEQQNLDQFINDYRSGKMKKLIYFWQIINLEYWYQSNFLNGHKLQNGYIE